MITDKSELLATRHAYTGQVHVLPEEEFEAFNKLTRDIVNSLTPVGALELQLAQCYATLQWRINRAAAIEDNLFTLGGIEGIAANLHADHPQVSTALGNARTFRTHAAAFVHISVYSQRLLRQAETVLKRLLQLQAERKQSRRDQLAEAARLYQLHTMHSAGFDPQSHGYQFNLGEIQAFVRSKLLNTQAKRAEEFSWDVHKFAQNVGPFAAAA